MKVVLDEGEEEPVKEVNCESIAAKEGEETDGKLMFGELEAFDELLDSDENGRGIEHIGWLVEAAPHASDGAGSMRIDTGCDDGDYDRN